MAGAVARFTAADEAVIALVSARLKAQSFVVERDATMDPDCYWIFREHSPNPSWVLLRTEDGLYQLRDDLLGIERQGRSLLEILPADWMPERGEPDLDPSCGRTAPPRDPLGHESCEAENDRRVPAHHSPYHG